MNSGKSNLYLLYFLLVLIPFDQVSAQTPLRLQPAPSQNRISENANRCLFKDSKGYIWIGTIDGLNRYDGYRFRVYHSDARDSSSISGNYITCVQEDSLGNIWVGTDKGINLYDPVIDGFKHFIGSKDDPAPLGSDYITNVLPDQNEQLWIAAYGGLGRFDYETQHFSGLPVDSSGKATALLHIDVTALGISSGQGFWIGYQEGGLSRYEAGQLIHYPNICRGLAVSDLLEDNNKCLWIGTNQGVYYFNPQNGDITKYHDGSTWDIYRIDDKVWFNISFEGIYEWNAVENRLQVVPVYLDNQPVFGDVKAFFKDETGIIWASYHGLFKQDPYEKRFQCVTVEPGNTNSLGARFVSGIAEDEKKNWVVMTIDKGLNYYDRATRRWLNHQTHPWYNNRLLGLRSSKLHINGHLVYVLGGDVVFEFNLQTGALQEFKTEGLTFGFTGSVAQANPQELWLGGTNVFRIDLQTGLFQNYSPKNITSSERPFVVFADRERHIWALTKNKLFFFDAGKQQFIQHHQFSNTQTEFGESIISTAVDEQGCFWIGRRNGLESFNPQNAQFRHYSIADGLPSNVINSILVDHKGKLWLGTNNGLSRFDPERQEFRNYDRSDGLQDEIFLPGSAFKSPDSRLYFGGVNGFNVFHPDSLMADNPHPPRLWITDLKIFNKSIIPGKNSVLHQPISETEALTLSYKHSTISFELLALGYSQPEKNQYAYMIEGVDPDWNYAGTGQTTASYTGLPRGEELLFKAKAANHDGIWNETPTVLQIYIRPPFWETSWFRIVLLVFLLGSILGYYRWRVRNIKLRNLWLEREVKKQTAKVETQASNLKEVNSELRHQAEIIKEQIQQLNQFNKAQSRFFTSLSHEFRTSLTLLLGNLEELVQASEPEKVIERISRRMKMSARQLLQLINQLMDTAKLESGQYKLRVVKGNMQEDISNICSLFQVLAERKSNKLQVFFKDSQTTRCWYDADILCKVLNNLLSNAIKFTEAGSIQVLMAIETTGVGTKQVFLQVSDTGVGISAAQLPFIFDRFFQAGDDLTTRKKGTGIGLSLVKLLVHLHKGQIKVESEQGKGTRVKIWLPVSKSDFAVAERSIPLVSEEVSLEQPVARATINKITEEPGSGKVRNNAPMILIVEDNPEIRSFIVRQLHSEYKITEAQDGAQALQLAIKSVPDLIISDVMMPKMDGFQLCDRLKQDQRTSHIPFILLTALADQEKRLEGLKQGADAYLSKPFSREELRLQIHNLLTHREKLRRRFLHEIQPHQFPDGLHPTDQEFLGTLNALIEKNITDENFGIEQLLKALGVSRTQLFRKLKSLTGMSASEFIRDFRLRKAYQLLHEEDLTISEVIDATGFNSRSYFYDSFRKKFGLAPSQLKKA